MIAESAGMTLDVWLRRVVDDAKIVVLCQFFQFKHEMQIAESD